MKEPFSLPHDVEHVMAVRTAVQTPSLWSASLRRDHHPPAGTAGKELIPMAHNDNVIPADPSFIRRVFTNDTFRKGIGTAVAGLLVATVVEIIWPSTPGS